MDEWLPIQQLRCDAWLGSEQYCDAFPAVFKDGYEPVFYCREHAVEHFVEEVECWGDDPEFAEEAKRDRELLTMAQGLRPVCVVFEQAGRPFDDEMDILLPSGATIRIAASGPYDAVGSQKYGLLDTILPVGDYLCENCGGVFAGAHGCDLRRKNINGEDVDAFGRVMPNWRY